MADRTKATAQMQWKGRKLLCNGVCVAELWVPTATNGWVWFGVSMDLEKTRNYSTESGARRAVNRRFKLPLDFGDPK